MSMRRIWELGALGTLIAGSGCATAIGLEPADHVFEGKPWTFDSDTGGWMVTVDLADLPSHLQEDTQVGYPEPGSAMLTAPFTGPLQLVRAGTELPTSLDVSERTIVTSIRIDQGVDPRNASRAAIYVQSGTADTPVACVGEWLYLSSAGMWSPMKFSGKDFVPTDDNCENADPPFDIRHVRSMGIQVETVTDEMPVAATPTIVHIDTFGYY